MSKRIITRFFSVFLACFLAAQTAYAISDLAYLINVSSTGFLPATIRAGDIVSMAINVSDRGEVYAIAEINGTLDVGGQFEPIDSNYFIPFIPAGATKTMIFKFRVKQDTPAGYYPLFLSFSYNRNGSDVSETQTLFVPVSKIEKNIDVTVEPRVINPGKQSKLVFTLSNISGSPIANISFWWDEKSDLILPLGSDNKRYISLVDAGKDVNVSYIVAADPNITPGIYPLDVNMTFTDSNGTKSQGSQVGIIVGGTTDFEVSAETTTAGQVSLSIANIGSNNASAVVVKIPQAQPTRVQGSNVSILGNLNKGDYTIATFNIQTATADRNALRQPGATGRAQQAATGQQSDFVANRGFSGDSNFFSGAQSNSLIVQIDYTDTTGERQSVQKTVQLSASSSLIGLSGFSRNSSSQQSVLPWALLVVFVGAAAGYNRFKAKRPWKPVAIVVAIIAALFLATIFLLNSDLLALGIASVISLAILFVFFRRGLQETTQGKAFSRGKKE